MTCSVINELSMNMFNNFEARKDSAQHPYQYMVVTVRLLGSKTPQSK